MRGELYELPQRWGAAISNWTAWMTTAGASYETIRVRRGIVRSVAKRLGAPGPESVTTDSLIAFCAAEQWSRDHRRNVRAALTRFYEWAVGAGICAENPADGLPRVAQPKPRPRPVTDSVWSELLAAAPPRERMMARLAGEAGLRRAEVAKVHSDDLVEDLYGYSLVVRGKGDKQRTVPLTTSLADAIHAHTTYGYLFPGQIDGHLSPNHVGKVLSRLMPAGCTAHKLRHRYASRGYAATGDILAVATALGHSSPATTQRYVQVPNAAVRAVSEAAA